MSVVTCAATGARPAALILALTLSTLALPGLAADSQAKATAASATTLPLEELVVSAARVPLPLAEVTASVDRISSAEIRASGAVEVATLLARVPGLALSRSGGIGNTLQLRTRGSESNHTLVLIDGVRANDLALGGEFDFAHLTTTNVASIEVLRGPQSALWGSDALAGVVTIRSNRGQGAARSQLSFESGSDATRIYSAATSGSSSGGQGTLDWSLAGTDQRSDGSNVSSTGKEDDGYDNRSMSGHLGWQARDDLSLALNLRHTDADSEFDGFDFVTALPTDADQHTRSKQLYVDSVLTWTPGSQWRQQLALQHTRTDNTTYDAGLRNNSSDGKRTRLALQGSRTLATAVGEQRLTLALEHTRDQFHQRGAASLFGDPNQNQQLDHQAAVLELGGDLPAAGTLLAAGNWQLALRHDRFDAFQDDSTWRAGLRLPLANSNLALHLSAGTGIRTPSFTERFGFTPDTFVGNPDLQAETSRGWEAGVHWQGRAVTARATWFSQELEDEILGFVFDPALLAFTASNGDGTSHRDGFELDLSSQPFDSLLLHAAWTWLDASQPDSNGAQAREIRRPKHQLALSGTWQMSRSTEAWLSIRHTGRQDDTLFTFPSQQVQLDAYTLVDATLTWNLSPRLSLFLRGSNLGDEDWQDLIGYETPGRTGSVGLRARFGGW